MRRVKGKSTTYNTEQTSIVDVPSAPTGTGPYHIDYKPETKIAGKRAIEPMTLTQDGNSCLNKVKRRMH